jgi:hypothetical protein
MYWQSEQSMTKCATLTIPLALALKNSGVLQDSSMLGLDGTESMGAHMWEGMGTATWSGLGPP